MQALKIDIDTPSIENAVVEEFLRRAPHYPAVRAGQAELFFEQHVLFQPMVKHWKRSALSSKKSLADTYALLLKLRQMGVRSHGWV